MTGPPVVVATENMMMRSTPATSLTDKIAGIVDRLLGYETRPAPVLVPVTVRRPAPIRVPVGRR